MEAEYKLSWPDDKPTSVRARLEDELRLSAAEYAKEKSLAPADVATLLHTVMDSTYLPRDPDSLAKSSATINPLTLDW